MPCPTGYKIITKAKISAPQPQRLKKRIEAPVIDEELLERIGEDDRTFMEWLKELDIVPLLNEALRRALAKVGSGNVIFTINRGGFLEADSEYKNNSQKKEIEKKINEVSGQWQMEILAIAAQLLDYELTINKFFSGSGETAWTIEGEKKETADVHKYLRIVKTSENSEIAFEHFETKKDSEQEMDKFLGLTQKLGVKIFLTETKKSGQPIPAGAIHKNFVKGI